MVPQIATALWLDSKPVSLLARQHIAGAHQRQPQGLRHGAQAGIAGGVAEAVVEPREVVDVDHQHRQRLAGGALLAKPNFGP